MNLTEKMLKELNVNYLIIDQNGKVISTNMNNENLIIDIISSDKKEDNIFKYKEKYYKCGIIKENNNTIYYTQDVSEFEYKYRKLKKDNLTRLYTRNVALPLIDDYIINSYENNEQFSVIIGDVDLFKEVNDTYGHDAGDKVLQDVALLLLNSFRTQDTYNFNCEKELRDNINYKKAKDVICRYGGEEFLILLKGINLENTLKRLEEVRLAVEEKDIVTISFGVYNIDPSIEKEIVNEENIEEIRKKIINKADQSLYYSKQNGRNQVSYFCDGQVLRSINNQSKIKIKK